MTPTATKIKTLRKSTGLTQIEFTFKILRGIASLQTLRNWEQEVNPPHPTKLEAVEKRVEEYLKEKRCDTNRTPRQGD